MVKMVSFTYVENVLIYSKTVGIYSENFKIIEIHLYSRTSGSMLTMLAMKIMIKDKKKKQNKTPSNLWFFGAQDCCVFYISCFPESHIFSVLFHNLNFQFSFIMASLLPLFSVKCLLNPSTYLFLCSPNISLMEPPYWLPIPFIISLIAGGGVIVVLKIIWIIQCDYGASQWQIPSANAGDSGSVPGSGRSPEGGNGNPLQYSCLGNPMDIGAWWVTAHGVAKSRT